MVDYDRNSYIQDQMVRSRAKRLRAAVESIGPVTPEFTVMDYGCGPGHSALNAVAPVIEAYRRIDPRGAVVIRHSDQMSNDWNATVCARVRNRRLSTQRIPDSHRSRGRDFLHATGIAGLGRARHLLCREPLAEPRSLAFVARNGVVCRSGGRGPCGARGTRPGRLDAIPALPRRGIAAGGMAIVSTLGSVPDDNETNGVRSSARKLYRAIYQVANQMVSDGLLEASALDRFVFPLWFPTAEEACAPIHEESDLKQAFEVLEASVTPAPVHPNDVYEDSVGDPETYARLYAGYVRGFAESTLQLHLFGPSAKNAAEVHTLTDEFFRRLTAYYQAAPGRHASEK